MIAKRKPQQSKTTQAIGQIIDLLAVRPLPVADLYNKVYPGIPREEKKASLNSLLQQMRGCSGGRIFTDNRFWQLKKGSYSDKEALREEITINIKQRWRENKSSKNAKGITATNEAGGKHASFPSTNSKRAYPGVVEIPLRVELTISVKIVTQNDDNG